MRKNYRSDPIRKTIATCNQPTSPFLTAPMRWAGRVAAVSTLLACISTASFAADMALKAPQPAAYQWSGCYVGANVGGGASGSNFDTVVNPGTHLLGGDPAVVAATGTGSHGGDGLIAGGQVGCNWQSGLFVAGLEGDFDYFHSNPWFSNSTITLTDGVTPFAVTQSVTTDYLATIRPRIGIAASPAACRSMRCPWTTA
jgi:outer membrane immunogenic protein